MAKQKKSDWRHLLSAGSIVVAVVGTVILGWALQSDPADPSVQMVIEGSIPDHQFPSPLPRDEVEAVEAPPEEAFPALAPAENDTLSDDLQERALQDRARMGAVGDGYTLQYATLCARESVQGKLAALSGYDRFYLIPAKVDGRDCHRLCWGIFPTREEALAARGIPRSLSGIDGQPAAMPLHKVAR